MAIKTSKGTAFKRIPKSRNTPGQMVIPTMSELEPNKKVKIPYELFEQKELFRHLFEWRHDHPDLWFVHSSLNGVPLLGKVARDAKESGMVSGVWDITLCASRKGFHGLFIEMKCGKNGLTPDQKKFQSFHEKEGYKLVVCYSWIEAASEILNYLDIEDDNINYILKVNSRN